ncbi:hypothetical protein [Bartonella machadoae]|uniref:hypothetical protein n=1 Tax=Bartonella machadoae TaxID=2893471 RepID=UPI001F4C977D|nr:hypothetical protein [Bartonella machadoae]UNE53924.1 hypothetical protein LNM86_10120 [Bartonella machadoae]
MVVSRGVVLTTVKFCCLFVFVLCWVYVNAGMPVVTSEVFLRGLVLCGVVGAVLGFIGVGAKSTTVKWLVFLKALVFCCIAGVALIFAYEKLKCSEAMRDISLIVAGIIALLELFVIVLSRVRSEWASRCVWLLRLLVFSGIVGVIVSLARMGAMDMGVRWFLISNDGVFSCMIGVIPLFAYEGVRCVRVLWAWLLERGVVTPRSR